MVGCSGCHRTAGPGAGASVGDSVHVLQALPPLRVGSPSGHGVRPLQQFWAHSSVGQCLEEEGENVLILNVLWKREEPWFRSPQKPLFQPHWSSSGRVTSKEYNVLIIGVSVRPTLGLGRGLLVRGKDHRVACGVVECAGGRENETRPGRQAMNGAGSVVTLLSNF